MTLTINFLAFVLSTLLTYHFSRPSTIPSFIDEPNHRSLHTRPIPLGGGIAIVLSLAITMSLTAIFHPFPATLLWIILSSLLIITVSFIDDCYTIPALPRLVVQFISAYLLLSQGDLWMTELLLPGWIWQWSFLSKVTVSLLFVVWMVNLYNFMDGMDGFAGGMALFGFGVFALFGWMNHHDLFMQINLLVVSVVAGFLLFNFPPARIFMGDVGSSTLGFLVAGFSLWANRENILPLWASVLLFSPFITDATVTLLRRLIRGEKCWLAHKSHYYQRLVQLGWGHKYTVLWEYVLMAGCSLSVLITPILPTYLLLTLLIGWIVAYSLLAAFVTHLEHRFKEKK